MAKKKAAPEAKFTNEKKVDFLQCDSVEKLETFLNEFEIDSFDNYGNNILHYYLNNTDGFSLGWEIIIPAILKKGLDINQKKTDNRFGGSPLILTIINNQKEIAAYLIEMGADVNARDADGNTALSKAVFNYRGEDGYLIELLLKHNADIHLENNYGVSAVGLAKLIANYDVAKFFN